MPVNIVRTPEDEIAWERAKERAREDIPRQPTTASIGL